MKEITVRFLHPGAARVEHGPLLQVSTPDFGGGCRLEVRSLDGHPVRIEARRGLTTSNELYWVETPSDALLFTDHFGQACQAVPSDRRSIPADALLDHLLFRTTPGHTTCLEGIARLGHGETAVWEAPEWRVARTQTQHLEFPEPASFDQGVREVEAALATAVEDNSGFGPGQRINLLSGGVDSTLLHAFLGASVPSASAGIDCPEFTMEVEYARAASALIGTVHRFVGISETAYPARLMECVQASGLPPHHLQTVLLDQIFRTADRETSFVTAQFADGLFGLDRAQAVARLHRMGAAAGLVAAARFLPGRLGARGRTADRIQRELAVPPAHPYSYASGFAVYGDRSWAERAFGVDAVRRRLDARLASLARLIPEAGWSVPSPEWHLTIGHLLDFWMDDTVSVWRQVAHARGVSLAAPFTHPEVVRAALRIPVRERYHRTSTDKPALKALLAARLPEYPVRQKKGASGLPADRLVSEGVLGPLVASHASPLVGWAHSALPLPTGGDGRAAWAALSIALWWNMLSSSTAPTAG